MALLLLQLSYSMHSKAILSSSKCHFCFSYHDLPIRWYTLVPPQILQFVHAPRKIPSIAFSLMVSSMGRASSTAVCCIDEACSSVGTVLGNIQHLLLIPLWLHQNIIHFSLQNPPKRTASIVGPLRAFLANPATPHCLLVSCAEVL